jgi:DNA-binding Xre family transcriptional regulator
MDKKTEFIENLIKQKYRSINEFSKKVGIPPSTLSTMFRNGIGGTAVDTIIKICNELNISVESLNDLKHNPFCVSEQEQEIIKKLRQLPPQELDKIIGMIEMKIYEFCSKKNDFQEA